MPKSFLVTVTPRRSGPVFVCKKCLKRVEGGDKLKTSPQGRAETQRRRAKEKASAPGVDGLLWYLSEAFCRHGKRKYVASQ
jgi:hypothetical protein